MRRLSENWTRALNEERWGVKEKLPKGEQDKQRCFHQFAETSAPSAKTTAKGR